ncbi:hypothetical protein EH31_03165 [Erythrobacter longus]|uniref:TIGR04222 domain-containing membrane protein n=1 Tax=Erythrobacter longus TaxID=1044 RepID=A0A074MA60_ERYLO|nr:TIGR04222 domain-containing membrane protein [Erythrobacter longus]KEO91686.1 hypothetical protein EH31_03165 [Erythrobacter longus]
MEIFSSYSGAGFLGFYALMLATCVAAGFWIPANLRPLGKRSEVEDLEEVAVLNGGADRLNLAVLSSLFAKGALTSGNSKKLFSTDKDQAESEAERAVLSKVGGFSLADAKRTLLEQAAQVEQRLIQRGLMMSEQERLRLKIFSTLPFAVLFVIGLYRQQAGAALGEPTGILIALLIVTFVLGLIRFFTGTKRTIAGQEVVMELEESKSRLRRAPQANEAGFAVALFGTGVLVGTPWEAVHAARAASAGGGAGGVYGGDDGGSDGGGGGCGGGGCGGCGG